MITEEIRAELFRLQDKEYRDFQIKLIPSVNKDTVIGVRTPALRKYAAQLFRREDIGAFLEELPHAFFDENQLHAFIISEIRDFEKCAAATDAFLPYVDNWATCDQLSPKVFAKHRRDLLPYIRRWIGSGETYIIRFGTGMLMSHFLDEDFDPVYPEMVAAIRSEEYYVRMMSAWYFATALVKQYERILPYLEERRLDVWTHNMAIRKACESRRISPEQKNYLKKLRRRES